MTDQAGQRQLRQQAFVPTTPHRLLSDEAMQYVDQVPRLQAQAAANPYLNGQDAERRLGGSDG
jgi:hypothetical protein